MEDDPATVIRQTEGFFHGRRPEDAADGRRRRHGLRRKSTGALLSGGDPDGQARHGASAGPHWRPVLPNQATAARC